MNLKTRIGIEIIIAAIVIGLAGNSLLRWTPWGLNVFMWTALLVFSAILITHRRLPKLITGKTASLYLALLFFSLMFSWRDSVELMVLNVLAMLTILAVLALPAIGLSLGSSGIVHYLIGSLWSAVSAAVMPLALISLDVKWTTLPVNGWTRHGVAALRGVLIAAPIILVFGALFMAADAVFEGIVVQTLHIDPEALLLHTFFIATISWGVAGYLRAATIGFGLPANGEPEPVEEENADFEPKFPYTSVSAHLSEEPVPNEETDEVIDAVEDEKREWDFRDLNNSMLPKFLTLGAIETGIVFGSLNMLFLMFVLIQIPYLFGGMDLVQNTPDFKLAEYARRGFGELVAVAALVLPLLLGAHWLLKREDRLAGRLFKAMAIVQIGLLFVIMASAVQRLVLLTGNLGYGLTTTRLYPSFFIAFLAAVFTWFAATVIRDQRNNFAWGALWIAFVSLGAMHFINPDDLIARTNIDLMKQGRMFDAEYNSRLSSDALPALTEGIGYMNAGDASIVLRNLSEMRCEMNGKTDLRVWNRSRSALANSAMVGNHIIVNGCRHDANLRFPGK